MNSSQVFTLAAAVTIALGLPAGTRLPGGGSEWPLHSGRESSSTETPSRSPIAPIPRASPPPSPIPDATAVDPIVPVRLRIPSLDVTAEIIPVGIEASREMEVPADIHDVGWYVPTAPGTFDFGSTVLVGHRDGASDPNGVFRELGTLDVGNTLRVVDASGGKHDFRVESVTSMADATFTKRAPQLFVSFGHPRLILLTCGGTYIRDQGGYQSTVVVIATPVDRSEADR